MFSIVIPNWNGERFIERLFDSLKRQTYKGFRVYFVDNNSLDGSVGKVQEVKCSLDVSIIHLDKNYGFARGTNAGIELAMKDDSHYIVTLNNDIELDSGCLECLCLAIEKDKDYDIFQILMVNYFNRNKIDAAGIEFDEGFGVAQLGENHDISNLQEIDPRIQGACAGAAAYSKRALRAIHDENGYFDINFFAYYEDVDLALRLLNQGFKTYLVKAAIAYHLQSGTGIEGSKFKTYYSTRNGLLYARKNLDGSEFRKFKSRYYKGLIKRCSTYFTRLDIKNIAATVSGLRDYYKMARKMDRYLNIGQRD